MLLRLTLHFVSLFRREAPHASRLSAKSKHFVMLAFCFQKKGGGRVSTQSICSQMLLRLTLHSVPLFRRYAPYASRLSAKSKHSVLAFCFQKKGRASLHAKHLLPNAARLTLTSFRYILYIFGFTLKGTLRNYILQNFSGR